MAFIQEKTQSLSRLYESKMPNPRPVMEPGHAKAASPSVLMEKTSELVSAS